MTRRPDDDVRFVDKRRGGFRSRFRPLDQANLPQPLGEAHLPAPAPLPPKPSPADPLDAGPERRAGLRASSKRG
jgi:hypothetical protein